MTQDAVLALRGVTKRFPGVVAVDGVDLELRAGEVHALCGENGAGKSTLIKLLSGIHPHGSYEGALEVGGVEARFAGIADAERAGIAVIYQELALVDGMSVAENIVLGDPPRRGPFVDHHAARSEAAELLARYGLAIDPDTPVGELGVGQQQLVEICKALRKEARILLLDEPTAALSEAEVDVLLGIVEDLRAKGVTCVYISHRLEEVFRVADRITVLRDGRSVGTWAAAGTDRDTVIRAMVGRELGELFPRRATEPGEVLLTVAELAVDAGGRRALDGIGFEVRAGEVLGIGGLMGAGRSELLLHLFGAYGRRVGGAVTLRGANLAARHPREAIAAGMMLVTEDRKRSGLVLDQDVAFNLSLASLGAIAPRGLIDAHREWRRNQGQVDALRIKAADQGVAVATLSGGNQQKVVLGKALLTAPKVVLLDEPTRGIDVGAKVEVYELINRLTAEGDAVVLVSSELPELLGMSDRILMLSAGRVGGTFTRDQATQEALLEAAMRHG